MLVTIVVITYNSSRYVLETLESAFRQTYNEIELIVSDDCSTDNTFALCQQWVEEHKERFVRTLCTQTPHNGGIVWNYNHALQLAHGEWIKYIAGDDILCHNCIEILVHNIKPDIFLYFSSMYAWNLHDNFVNINESPLPNANWRRQLRFCLQTPPCVPGATLFIEKKHLIHLGGFDIRYPFVEDLPIAFCYLTNKYRIGIISIPIVIWRYHIDNTSVANTSFGKNLFASSKYYTLRYCWRRGLFLHQYHYFTFHYILNNYHRGGMRRFLGYLFHATDILYWKRKIFPVKEYVFKTSEPFPFSQALIENHEYDLQQQ